MECCFNQRPTRLRYNFTWRVSSVLEYLKTLFPLQELTMKMLTCKLTALLALSLATRAQTLVALNIDSMNVLEDRGQSIFCVLYTTQNIRLDWTFNNIMNHLCNIQI